MVSLLKKNKKESATASLVYDDGSDKQTGAHATKKSFLKKSFRKGAGDGQGNGHGGTPAQTPPPTPDDDGSPEGSRMQVTIVPRDRSAEKAGGGQGGANFDEALSSPAYQQGQGYSAQGQGQGQAQAQAQQGQVQGHADDGSSVAASSGKDSFASSLMTRIPLCGGADDLNTINEDEITADAQLRKLRQGDGQLAGQKFTKAPVWGVAPSMDDEDDDPDYDEPSFGEGGLGSDNGNGSGSGNKANESYDDIECVLQAQQAQAQSQSPARGSPPQKKGFLGRGGLVAKPPSPVKTPTKKKSKSEEAREEMERQAVVAAARRELLLKAEEAKAREAAEEAGRAGRAQQDGREDGSRSNDGNDNSDRQQGQQGQQGQDDFVDATVASALETWRSATDPATGRTYYYNRVTKETKWDPPAELVDAYKTVVARKAAVAVAAASATAASSAAAAAAANRHPSNAKTADADTGADADANAYESTESGSAVPSTAAVAPSSSQIEGQQASRTRSASADRQGGLPAAATAAAGAAATSAAAAAGDDSHQKKGKSLRMMRMPAFGNKSTKDKAGSNKTKKKGGTGKKDAKAADEEAAAEAAAVEAQAREEVEEEGSGAQQQQQRAAVAAAVAVTATAGAASVPTAAAPAAASSSSSPPISLEDAAPHSRQRSEPRAAAVELVPGDDGTVEPTIERVTSADTVDGHVPQHGQEKMPTDGVIAPGEDKKKGGNILKNPIKAVRSMSAKAGAKASSAAMVIRGTRSMDDGDDKVGAAEGAAGAASEGGKDPEQNAASGVPPTHPSTSIKREGSGVGRGKFGISLKSLSLRKQDSKDGDSSAASSSGKGKGGGKFGTSYWTPPRSQSASNNKATPSSKKRAPGWRSVVDSTSGKTYYYHTATKETRWDKPEGFDEIEAASTERTKKKSPKKGGFVGWKPVLDKDSGRTYYYHTATKEVTWVKPEGFEEERAAAAATTAAAAAAAKDDSPGSPQRQVQLTYPDTPPRTRSRASTAPDSPPRTTNMAVMGGGGAGEVREFEPVSLGDNLEMSKALARALPEEEENHDRLLAAYKGREDALVVALDELQEETPFDERIEYDAVVAKMEQIEARPATKFAAPLANGQGPAAKTRGGSIGLTNRTYSSFTAGTGTVMTGLSSMSGMKSKGSEKTARIANTTKRTGDGAVPTITEEENDGDTSLSSIGDSPDRPKQSALIQDPRDRGDANMQAKTSAVLQPVLQQPPLAQNPPRRDRFESAPSTAGESSSKRSMGLNNYDDNYAGDEDDNDDGDESVTDSISALSTSDVEFAGMRSRQVKRKKKALGEAMEKKDWERAAAAANELKANKGTVPSGRSLEGSRPNPRNNAYQKARRDESKEWTQTELDKFISQNDWNSVAQYIAVMRNNSSDRPGNRHDNRDVGSSDRYGSHMGSRSHDYSDRHTSRRGERAPVLPRKQVGARSQLQHEYLSDSSWDSESASDDDSEASDWESLTSGPSHDYGNNRRRDGRRNFPPKDVGMKQMQV